jgi:hypothetical protein
MVVVKKKVEERRISVGYEVGGKLVDVQCGWRDDHECRFSKQRKTNDQ